MKVTATKKGYFGGKLRQEGDTFECGEKEFSEKWMKKVGGKKSEKKSEKTAETSESPILAGQ